ncbi:MAG TPA: VOC family protein [Bryobacteraceae bacterium]|nr:VOC family protein [Bryobacteraceae bacterium]
MPQAVPEGYRGATPYLCCRHAAEAIRFYSEAFGAREGYRLADSSGKIGHAEIRIGEAVIMLSDEFPELGVRSPLAFGGSPVTIHVYVEDVDALASRAAAAGAKVLRPPENQFYGDRVAKLEDPFGHLWMFASHLEDVSEAEIRERSRKLFGQS